MVESTFTSTSTLGRELMSKNGTVSAIFAFLSEIEQVKLQQLNKRMYDSISPGLFAEIPVQNLTFILEKNRKEFYICKFNSSQKE
jgi:hypothetical protein